MPYQAPLSADTQSGEESVSDNDREIEVFSKLLDGVVKSKQSPKPIHQISSMAALAFIATSVAIAAVNVPLYVRLGVEGIYFIEPAHAAYHFTMENPSNREEPLYLTVKLDSPQPIITSHNDITTTIDLVPNIEWRKSHPTAIDLPHSYILIFDGSDCVAYHPESALKDGSCYSTLIKQQDGSFHNSVPLFLRYTSAGDFPVLLANANLFNGTVTNSGIQHLEILPVESLISNVYAYYAATLAIATLVFLLAFEMYKWYAQSKKSSSTNH